MKRITLHMLEQQVKYLNRITGNNPQPWTNGKANVGSYYLSRCYGGVSLHQMVNPGGAVNAPLTAGHVPKRKLDIALKVYIRGLEDSK